MFYEFGPHLYLGDGPTVSFYGLPYPTRILPNSDIAIRFPDGTEVPLAADLTISASGPKPPLDCQTGNDDS